MDTKPSILVLSARSSDIYYILLPDCMFICKMLQSDWLDSGTWTIYTFPYRRSGPFVQLSIKVKTQDFWENGRETIDRGSEMLVTFGKLSVNLRKLSGKT